LESSKEIVQRGIEVWIFEVMDSWKFFHIYSLIYNPAEQMFVKAAPLQKYSALFLHSLMSVGEVFDFHAQCIIESHEAAQQTPT
jgi:hypothetical protein